MDPTPALSIHDLVKSYPEVLRIENPSKVLMDSPITVVGRLHVKERWEGPFLCSIYQLDAVRVVEG